MLVRKCNGLWRKTAQIFIQWQGIMSGRAKRLLRFRAQPLAEIVGPGGGSLILVQGFSEALLQVGRLGVKENLIERADVEGMKAIEMDAHANRREQ